MMLYHQQEGIKKRTLCRMANSALTYVNAYVTLYNITQYLSFVKGGMRLAPKAGRLPKMDAGAKSRQGDPAMDPATGFAGSVEEGYPKR